VEDRTMNCGTCGGALGPEVRETVPYDCGLPVMLVGVLVRRCTACDDYEVVIPAMEKLHAALAQAVAHKQSRLTPTEIRFLRKGLGWSGQDMAKRLRVSPEVVSRWENGKRNMSWPAEILLRVLAVNEKPLEFYEDRKFLVRRDALHFLARPERNEWTLETQAA